MARTGWRKPAWRGSTDGDVADSSVRASLLGLIVARAEDGTVKAQHGDWQVVCKPPPAGAKGEVCALVQSVSAEDRQNVGLTIYFQKFANGSRVLARFRPARRPVANRASV